MNQIASCGALLFLAILSPEDIKEKQVSVKTVMIFGLLALVCRIVAGQDGMIKEMIFSLVPGMFLLILSMASKESIGLGDGMAAVVLGLWMGGYKTFLILCIAWMLAGGFALICLLRKQKEPIPFIPFLLLGLEVLLFNA